MRRKSGARRAERRSCRVTCRGRRRNSWADRDGSAARRAGQDWQDLQPVGCAGRSCPSGEARQIKIGRATGGSGISGALVSSSHSRSRFDKNRTASQRVAIRPTRLRFPSSKPPRVRIAITWTRSSASSCASNSLPLGKSRTRAPGLSPARDTIWGAQGFRVRLTDGLARTKITPTSVPTARRQSTQNSHPFHILPVGDLGARLTRN
jgi:hypothetical protein